MTKRPIQAQKTSWAIYHLKHTPAEFVGIIDDAPDAETAIERAVEKLGVSQNERGRLLAKRRVRSAAQ